MVILWLDYIPMLVKMFRLFHCTEVMAPAAFPVHRFFHSVPSLLQQVADKWYLNADPNLVCYDIWWLIFVFASLGQLWLFIICLPLTQWEMVRRIKSRHVEHYLSIIFDPAPVEAAVEKDIFDPYV